jgi:ankyrin repeat protein
MNLPPPPQHDDPIITQFKPEYGQWELNDVNINRIDTKTGETILHNYCRYINTTPLAVYQYLIETKCCDVNAQNGSEDTPLHRATFHFSPNEDGSNIAVLHYLLCQNGTDVNIKGQYDSTLLHKACININSLPLETFKLLIETHGADVNLQNIFGETPIYNALFYFKPDQGGDITVLNYLLAQKAININIKDEDGSTLLHMACEEINSLPLDAFRVLIETIGCDVNLQNEYDDSPIHLALYRFKLNHGGGNTAVLAYLINQKNVNVNIKDSKGCNLLHLVCISNLSDSKDSAELNAEYDSILSQTVEDIIQTRTRQILDGTTP